MTDYPAVFRCCECAIEQQSMEHLEQHIWSQHLQAFPFRCTECHSPATNSVSLLEHYAQDHADVTNVSFTRNLEDENRFRKMLVHSIVVQFQEQPETRQDFEFTGLEPAGSMSSGMGEHFAGQEMEILPTNQEMLPTNERYEMGCYIPEVTEYENFAMAEEVVVTDLEPAVNMSSGMGDNFESQATLLPNDRYEIGCYIPEATEYENFMMAEEVEAGTEIEPAPNVSSGMEEHFESQEILPTNDRYEMGCYIPEVTECENSAMAEEVVTVTDLEPAQNVPTGMEEHFEIQRTLPMTDRYEIGCYIPQATEYENFMMAEEVEEMTDLEPVRNVSSEMEEHFESQEILPTNDRYEMGCYIPEVTECENFAMAEEVEAVGQENFEEDDNAEDVQNPSHSIVKDVVRKRLPASDFEYDREAQMDELIEDVVFAANQGFAKSRQKKARTDNTPICEEESEKSLTCDVCQKTFRFLSKLTEHHRTHSGERPYRCRFPNCAFRFAQNSSRTTHERTHTNERPFECEYGCGMSFLSASAKAQHEMANHTSLRPFSCNLCTKEFKRGSHLNRHMKTVHRKNKERRKRASS